MSQSILIMPSSGFQRPAPTRASLPWSHWEHHVGRCPGLDSRTFHARELVRRLSSGAAAAPPHKARVPAIKFGVGGFPVDASI